MANVNVYDYALSGGIRATMVGDVARFWDAAGAEITPAHPLAPRVHFASLRFDDGRRTVPHPRLYEECAGVAR